MKIYLDNAATTRIDEEVFEEMKPLLLDNYGNPSSVHGHGRKAKTSIESARKKIATLMKVTTSEIFFTSGGTEANNTILNGCIQNYDIKHIISSKIEHSAVLKTLENISKNKNIRLSYVNLDNKGNIDLNHLETLLSTKNSSSMVSLMHANNEIGNLLDIKTTGELCEKYDAFFHSDTVQTVGHYDLNLTKTLVDYATGAAHKFHGPKGVGFMYISKEKKIPSFILGGGQERGMRGGTENVSGIVGMAKALEIAYRDLKEHQQYIQSLKNRMKQKLIDNINGVSFNGESSATNKSLYTVLNVCLPESDDNDILLFSLDINGVSASGGSACSSGAIKGSHVINEIQNDNNRASVRFSFSKYNKASEIDYVVDQLVEFYGMKISTS